MGRRRDITFPMFGDGIFNQEGAAWKHSRELLRSPLQHKHYENLDVFKQSVDDLIDILSSQSGVVDLQPLFFRLTLDVTTEFLFGESVKSLKVPKSAGEQTFGEAFNTAQEFVTKRFRLPDFYWMIGGSKFRKACNDVHYFADQIIDRNLSRSSEKSRVFLDVVAESTADREALRGQIINLLVAGRDTTACLLTWTFFLLVRHPKVLEKLREGINRDCSDPASLTRTDLRKMGYLQNVLKETLRLYPSVPVNTRTANKTTVLPTGGGPDRTAPVLIPKGSTVAYSVYAMHRRPDLYGMDAELFRPERWDEDMPMHRDKTNAVWGYLPFNGGPRICLGRKLQLNLKNRGKYTD
jgi:cytochrome P450